MKENTREEKRNAVAYRNAATAWAEIVFTHVSNKSRTILAAAIDDNSWNKEDKRSETHISGIPKRVFLEVLHKATANIPSKAGIQDEDLMRVAAKDIVDKIMKREFGSSAAGIPEKELKKMNKAKKVDEDEEDDEPEIKVEVVRCTKCKKIKKVYVTKDGERKAKKQAFWAKYGVTQKPCSCE